MDLLPETYDTDSKQHKLLKTFAANAKLKVWVIVMSIILVLGITAFVLFYSNIRNKVEADLTKDFDKQIKTLQNELEECKEKYEEKISKQKESYEEKLADAETTYEERLAKADEKNEKAIEKKDATIAELEEKIRLLEVKDKISFDEIEIEIKEVGKLTTLDYHYTYAGTHEDVETFFKTDIKLPWTKNSFIAQWDGVVALGVDLSKVKLNVNENAKTINVSIPKAEIFYHDVDEESFEVLDEKNNIFNPITIEDKIQFDIKYENKIFEKIEDNRMLEDAYENAQILIENILKTDSQISEQYTIKYQ